MITNLLVRLLTPKMIIKRMAVEKDLATAVVEFDILKRMQDFNITEYIVDTIIYGLETSYSPIYISNIKRVIGKLRSELLETISLESKIESFSFTFHVNLFEHQQLELKRYSALLRTTLQKSVSVLFRLEKMSGDLSSVRGADDHVH